mgnify:CR=1 FL=1
MPARIATARDLDRIVEAVTEAFRDDPVWGIALRRKIGRAHV